jgi:O-6-methylguanine DNA methyltransferase
MSYRFNQSRYESPMGPMLIVTDQNGALRALDWTTHEARMQALLARQYKGISILWSQGPAPDHVVSALDQYFAGKLDALDGLAIATGGTPFQNRVWAALRTIPAGRTLSYGALALQIGMPAAVRAVGLANGANPIGIVVPCHRVIGANGKLTGYGGGVERKAWLLSHEGVATMPW